MKLTNITKRYGEVNIFEKFSIEFEENKVTAVMGASGIGKSTLVNIMAGLTPYDGYIESEGDISCVFSEPALLPNLTVRGNLEYAVAHRYKDKLRRSEAIENVLEAVELSDRAGAYPAELSTGMAQRVSMARGFLYPSRYILLDEAFRGLDTALKTKLERYFLKLLESDPRTVIMITHDVNEALLLADRLVVIDGSPAAVVMDRNIESPKTSRKLSDPDLQSVSDEFITIVGL